MLNPEIIKKDGAYETEEGCLSLLGGPRKCRRYKSIKVRYQTTEMQTRIKTYTGWAAQIIQHESDPVSYTHLDEGVEIDENGNVRDKGNYGPYKQSQRAELYHVFAKKLVSEGKAYPCFSTEEELEEIQPVSYTHLDVYKSQSGDCACVRRGV